MQSGIVHLEEYKTEQKRLQAYFDDKRIRYGFNRQNHEFQVWYVPVESRPYRVCSAVNVSHAIKQLEARAANDKKRARDMLSKMDAHNQKLVDNRREDAMHEVRQHLRQVAAGKRFYTV